MSEVTGWVRPAWAGAFGEEADPATLAAADRRALERSLLWSWIGIALFLTVFWVGGAALGAWALGLIA